jgi:hypothetical protein
MPFDGRSVGQTNGQATTSKEQTLSSTEVIHLELEHGAHK